MIRHVLAVARRELSAYFLGPMAYIVLLGFQMIAAINFFVLVELLSRPQAAYSGLADPMTTYVSSSWLFWIALLVAVPCVTMRLLAEERRSGTLEGLLTAPITEAEVVLGKWIAGTAMILALLAPFALYLPFLRHYGRFDFDLGPLLTLGICLTTLAMMFAAIGLSFSALARNQIEAAIGTFVVMLLLLLVEPIGTMATAGRGDWQEALRFVSVVDQAAECGRGLLDLRVVALHTSITVLLLYLATRALAARRGA